MNGSVTHGPRVVGGRSGQAAHGPGDGSGSMVQGWLGHDPRVVGRWIRAR